MKPVLQIVLVKDSSNGWFYLFFLPQPFLSATFLGILSSRDGLAQVLCIVSICPTKMFDFSRLTSLKFLNNQVNMLPLVNVSGSIMESGCKTTILMRWVLWLSVYYSMEF